MKSEAWVLRRGQSLKSGPGELEKMVIDLPPMAETDVLAEPLFGCWEGNMTHAVERDPVDVCLLRHEKQVVLGNAGVVRILQVGPSVTKCKPGDICLTAPNATWDKYGNTTTVFGYDQPGTMGVLSKQVVFSENCIEPLVTRHALDRWAGFPIRFTSAWDNWKLTFGIWKLHFEGYDLPEPRVWSWGGGVGYAELLLAKHDGCHVTMITSHQSRIDQLHKVGINVVDRSTFEDMWFDPVRWESDGEFRARYHEAETRFLREVKQRTNREGVSIFIENIGSPVFHATVKALGRLGIITTCGWKLGKPVSYHRAGLCLGRNILVHSHACKHIEGIKAANYAEEHEWLPPENPEICEWNDIPDLVRDYQANKVTSYFPTFRINPV